MAIALGIFPLVMIALQEVKAFASLRRMIVKARKAQFCCFREVKLVPPN